MRNGRRIIAMLLVLLLIGSFFGCAPSQPPMNEDATQNEGNAQNETVPSLGPSNLVTKPGGLEMEGFEAPQIRLHNVQEDWKAQFEGEYGCFVVVQSRQELLDLIAQFPGAALDGVGYDDAYFAENRLVVIPRTSNSGSVRYLAKVTLENGMANITLTGKVDGEGTMDMANWLVLVDLPLDQYAADVQVSVPSPGGTGVFEK